MHFFPLPRRFVWNFFRLENEHLNNCGEFRAVRDISVAPLNADDQTLLEQMMDQEDGVRNRQGKKSWKRSYSMSLRRPRLASQWVLTNSQKWGEKGVKAQWCGAIQPGCDTGYVEILSKTRKWRLWLCYFTFFFFKLSDFAFNGANIKYVWMFYFGHIKTQLNHQQKQIPEANYQHKTT